jgi:hypothetical protein
MTSRFKNLADILNSNPGLRDKVFQEFEGKNASLSIFDELFSFFIHDHKDELIAKIKDTNTLPLFCSLIAELNSARIFARKGCEIKLLTNNYFRGPSPDILCKCPELTFYVESTSLSDSSPLAKIYDELRELLRTKPFEVNVNFHENVSQPRFSGEEHTEQETLLEKSLDQFKKDFEQLIPESPRREIKTEGITFFLTPTKEKPGCLGGYSSGSKFPKEIFEKFVTVLLLKKAKKRENFFDSARNYPYIVTFVSRNILVDAIDFHRLLYGFIPRLSILPIDQETDRRARIFREEEWNVIIRDKQNYIPRWQDIEAAAKNGWTDFLTKIHYIPNDYTYLGKEGLFLSEPLMKNVSGILLVRKSMESHFFPNPFCDPEISLVNHQEFFISAL